MNNEFGQFGVESASGGGDQPFVPGPPQFLAAAHQWLKTEGGYMTTGDIIQIAAVIVAVGASLVALVIASMDRRNAIKIAEDDRRAATDQARLLAELQAAIRLSVLEARGGHTNPAIRKDMGAETLALIAMLGPDRVPEMWKRRVEKSDEKLRAFIADENEPQFLRDAAEAERAVHDILRDLGSSHPGTSAGR